MHVHSKWDLCRICEVEDQSWIVDEEDKERIRRLMLPEIGDRRQEIVFIGKFRNPL